MIIALSFEEPNNSAPSRGNLRFYLAGGYFAPLAMPSARNDLFVHKKCGEWSVFGLLTDINSVFELFNEPLVGHSHFTGPTLAALLLNSVSDHISQES
jgi:hypothetical protein